MKTNKPDERGRKAEDLLDRLLDWAISNRSSRGKSNIDGKECRFVTCHSYHSNAFPQVLIDAMKFMGDPVSGLKRERKHK